GLTGDEQKSAEKANEDKTRIDKEAALEAYKISEANKPYGKYAYYGNLTEEEKGKVKYHGICGFGRKTYSAEERAEHESKYIVPRPK
ncbi:hypothetical protein M3M33_15045, partial [Loigolactobacillus coryniformis]|uniref:hypothetical protein n=1 Tax=Loigolactobacillus coryniformis TaxID=1610 RepID=UPI00201B24B9